jgi:hypothetical protein
MEIYSIEVREFKGIFYTSLSMMALFIVGSFLWVSSGFVTFSIFSLLRILSSWILIGMMLLTIVYGSYRRKRMNAINTEDDFSVKVKEYVKIYKLHNAWFVLSCFVSCFLFVVTSRNFFFYFACVQLLITLAAYPSRALFKRELKNEEVVVY